MVAFRAVKKMNFFVSYDGSLTVTFLFRKEEIISTEFVVQLRSLVKSLYRLMC